MNNLTSKDILTLTGNIVNMNGDNNNKLINVILKPFNILLDIADNILDARYIDDLIGINLDKYARDRQITRPKGMSDEDFRNFIKAMVYIRGRGGTFNDIVNSLSLLFNIPPTNIKLYESNKPKRINLVVINEAINIETFLNFILQVKAAGIILECYQYIINSPVYEYDTVEFDSIYFPVRTKTTLINCKGEEHEINEVMNLSFEYDKHKFNITKDSLNDR